MKMLYRLGFVLLLAPMHSAWAQFALESPAALRAEHRGRVAAGCRCFTNVPDDNEIALATPASQVEEDLWFGADKVRHFFVSAMLQSLGYGALRAFDLRHGSALAGASVMTAGFGIGKELSDRRNGRRVSARDLIWDAAGAGAATLLLVRTER
jgi:uncharacterized protein YfiM (DUF2279 family)